jgi:hypothetical protein
VKESQRAEKAAARAKEEARARRAAERQAEKAKRARQESAAEIARLRALLEERDDG